MKQKSTVAEIRARFDNDVDRFANLESGQTATIDAPLVLDLIKEAAARVTPHAKTLLDVGCGAGNYTLKLLERLPDLNVILVDLSRPMLERAVERITPLTTGLITTHQADIRDLPLEPASIDIITAAAVLHHLRTPQEWRAVFEKIYGALRPSGSLWISDLVTQQSPAIQELMWQRYGDYLADFKDETYRETVFTYIEKEDSPAPLLFQLDLLREVGFKTVDLLHKNGPFAAFGALI